MGSKFRLLPWIYEIISDLDFTSALDAFSGSGCVSYLLKCMGKEVHANDFMSFSAVLADATVANQQIRLTPEELQLLLSYDCHHPHFIEKTFTGIFYTPEDLRFLDRVWGNIPKLKNRFKRSLAISSLIRSCAKRQPRGVFTVAGDPERYKDHRRDLKLSLHEHFLEHVESYNSSVFDNGFTNTSRCGDIFDLPPYDVDLVYLDPPYVPRADDNCYIKRYHFLEGLSNYWDGMEIMQTSRVKKLQKRYTPFSYQKSSCEAFDQLFSKFSDSIIVLSYSSNGYPDLEELVRMMRGYKKTIDVFKKEHRYHFGTHQAASRNAVNEYLVIGT